MRYISIFSGIEASSAAWEKLGWLPLAFSEIEPFPCRVLAHHFPDVVNLGDIKQVEWGDFFSAADVVVGGGSPCQAFSSAGNRRGLMDERGRLMFEYIRCIKEVRPRWFIWENVPGVLSQDKGSAFAALLLGLEECGYSLAWRVLDAQYFGVAQRRRRVFVIGHIGDAAGPPAAVLFERESLREYPRSGEKKRKELAALRGANLKDAYGIASVTAHTLDFGTRGTGVSHESSFTLTCSDRHIVCYDQAELAAQPNDASFVEKSGCIRRLTPLECERLQGFPDGWTDIDSASDNARYKALGNSMAVPVMEWLGRRIDMVDKIMKGGEDL